MGNCAGRQKVARDFFMDVRVQREVDKLYEVYKSLDPSDAKFTTHASQVTRIYLNVFYSADINNPSLGTFKFRGIPNHLALYSKISETDRYLLCQMTHADSIVVDKTELPTKEIVTQNHMTTYWKDVCENHSNLFDTTILRPSKYLISVSDSSCIGDTKLSKIAYENNVSDSFSRNMMFKHAVLMEKIEITDRLLRGEDVSILFQTKKDQRLLSMGDKVLMNDVLGEEAVEELTGPITEMKTHFSDHDIHKIIELNNLSMRVLNKVSVSSVLSLKGDIDEYGNLIEGETIIDVII